MNPQDREAMLRTPTELCTELFSLYRVIVDGASAMIWMCGTDGMRSFFNQTWLDFRGRTLQQEQTDGWTCGVHPDDLQAWREAFSSAFVRHAPFEAEYRLARHNGEYGWVLERAAPFYSPTGEFAGYIGSCLEITERKEFELSVVSSEERFRLAAEGARLGAWEWDLADRVIWSESLEAMFGLEPGGFPGTLEAFAAALHPDDRERVLGVIDQARRDGRDVRFEERIVLPSGEVRWLQSNTRLVLDTAGRPQRMVGICIDITDRKRAEFAVNLLSAAGNALHRSLDQNERLQALADLLVPSFADWFIVDLLEDGELKRVLVHHRDPAMVDWAQELQARYPPDPEAVQGPQQVVRTGVSELVPEIPQEMLEHAGRDEMHRKILRELGLVSYIGVPLATHGVILGALTLITSDSRRHYDERDLGLAEELGRRVCRAIENARLYQESELARAQLQLSNRAKDEFLGIVSHELRSPLTAVFGSARLLRNRWRSLNDAEVEEMLEAVSDGSERMVQLVDNLLLLAAAEVGQTIEKSLTDVSELAHKVIVRLFGQRPEREIDSSSVKPGAVVACVPAYLEQMLANLLTNADKYSPADEPIELAVWEEGGETLFRVRDRGPGVSREELPLLFDAFFRSRRSAELPGKGLGLAVCRRLAEAQGGRVWAKPRKGGGLEVGFALPLETAEPVEPD